MNRRSRKPWTESLVILMLMSLGVSGGCQTTPPPGPMPPDAGEGGALGEPAPQVPLPNPTALPYPYMPFPYVPEPRPRIRMGVEVLSPEPGAYQAPPYSEAGVADE